MSDDLRDRVAVVLAGHHTDCEGSFLQCECDARWRSIHAWADHVADAVIRELGLQPDLAKRIINGKPDQWVCRHVTDWEIVIPVPGVPSFDNGRRDD